MSCFLLLQGLSLPRNVPFRSPLALSFCLLDAEASHPPGQRSGAGRPALRPRVASGPGSEGSARAPPGTARRARRVRRVPGSRGRRRVRPAWPTRAAVRRGGARPREANSGGTRRLGPAHPRPHPSFHPRPQTRRRASAFLSPRRSSADPPAAARPALLGGSPRRESPPPPALRRSLPSRGAARGAACSALGRGRPRRAPLRAQPRPFGPTLVARP